MHFRRGLLFAGFLGLAASAVLYSWSKPPVVAEETAPAPAAAEESETPKIIKKSDAEWRKILTAQQFKITRKKGTERAFTGAFWNHKEKGEYRCVCCGAPLFPSATKFASGCGWPSYFKPLDNAVTYQPDLTLGMRRIEVNCARCEAHLGHVFNDGPPPTGLRFCINSASLTFEKEKAETAAEPKQTEPASPQKAP